MVISDTSTALETLKASAASLNSQQQEAAFQPGNQAVQVVAGAGTGKTELIAHRFVHLVREFQAQGIPNPQHRIAVVTFTNEAALNMRLRIDDKLQAGLGLALDSQSWISNFHQLANRILRQQALQVNLPPQFDILEPFGQRVQFHRMINSIVSGEYEVPAFKKMLARIFMQYGLTLPDYVLTPDYLKSIGLRRLSDIIAPEPLMHAIQQAKAAGLSPQAFYETTIAQSQRLTQALKTMPVQEIYEATPENSKGKPDPLAIITGYIEAWKKHLAPWADEHWDPIAEAEQQAELKGTTANATAYKNAVKEFVEVYCEKGSKTYTPKDTSELVASLEESQKFYNALIGVVSAVYALYQHSLRVKTVCDFDDLINHCLTLFDAKSELAEQYQEQFLHVIVDEFQDSNTSQLRLLKHLTKAGQSNLTVVGDQKQSIYGFRFAQPDNLKLAFDTPERCQSIPLNTNYRSYPSILSVANALSLQIVGNTSQHLNPCERYAEQTEPVRWCTFGIPEEVEDKKGGVKLKEESMTTQKEREALWIADEIERLVNAAKIQEKPLRFNDIAVLSKSHGKAEDIQQALNAKGIPSVRKKNLGFFEDAAIKTALALLQLMINLNDDTSLVRVLQSKLTHKQLYHLAQARDGLQKAYRQRQQELGNLSAEQKPQSLYSLFDVLFHLEAQPQLAPEITGEIRSGLTQLATLLLNLRKRQGRLSASQLLQALGKEIGIIQADTPGHMKHQQRVNLRTLEKWLMTLTMKSPIHPTLREILTVLSEHQEDPTLDLPVSDNIDAEDAVQLMTVHASKGLEFAVVFVAWCEKAASVPKSGVMVFDPQNAFKAGFGLFTGKVLNGKTWGERTDSLQKAVYQTTWQRAQQEQEQQRLFYVALTRAKQKLYVLRSRQSPLWTKPPVLPHQDAISHWIEADENTGR